MSASTGSVQPVVYQTAPAGNRETCPVRRGHNDPARRSDEYLERSMDVDKYERDMKFPPSTAGCTLSCGKSYPVSGAG